MLSYADSNKLLFTWQSGFHEGNSAKSLLPRQHFDTSTCGAVDKSQLTILRPTLFDVGAAFSSVDNGLLPLEASLYSPWDYKPATCLNYLLSLPLSFSLFSIALSHALFDQSQGYVFDPVLYVSFILLMSCL